MKPITLKLAHHLLTLPDGSWPETQNAQEQMRDTMSQGESMEELLLTASKGAKYIHPSRVDSLRRSLSSRYVASDFQQLFPALAEPQKFGPEYFLWR